MNNYKCIIILLFFSSCFEEIDLNPKKYFAKATVLDSTILCLSYNFELIFFDEFNEYILDTSKWATYFPYGYSGNDSCEFCRTHGDEGQIYIDDNVKINNGLLFLETKKEKVKWFNQERNFSSGMIHSKNKYKFEFGKFELKEKIPEGMGFWPAFWLYGDSANEIDIFEFGCQNTKFLFTNIHKEIDSIHYSWIEKHKSRYNLSDDFHVYTMISEINKISFYIDDELIREMPKYWDLSGKEIVCSSFIPSGIFLENLLFPENPMNLIVNLAIGTEETPFTKTPSDETIFPNSLIIDYIRVYKLIPKTP